MELPLQPEQQPISRTPFIPPSFSSEEEIKNIVGQIDPKHILDNLNHSLKGEYFNKEEGVWEKVGEELVNDACRGWIVTFFSTVLNNASTMGIISETQFSYLMEGIIDVVTREFRCNLEKFGFVPPGSGYSSGRYENKGTPSTSRMKAVSEMIFQRAFIVYSRSIRGSENKRVFKSLSFTDTGGYGDYQQQPVRRKGWISRLTGG